jgi:hypothetical protein
LNAFTASHGERPESFNLRIQVRARSGRESANVTEDLLSVVIRASSLGSEMTAFGPTSIAQTKFHNAEIPRGKNEIALGETHE